MPDAWFSRKRRLAAHEALFTLTALPESVFLGRQAALQANVRGMLQMGALAHKQRLACLRFAADD